MDGGRLTVEGSTLVPGTDYGVPKTIPVQFFLVETTKGFVLIDSGNDPDVITDPIGAWGFDLASASNPDVQPHNHPLEQLKLVGLGADDIKMVIYTHLHHDHCGAARFFPEALHVVQKAEHRWAFQPDSLPRSHTTKRISGTTCGGSSPRVTGASCRASIWLVRRDIPPGTSRLFCGTPPMRAQSFLPEMQ